MNFDVIVNLILILGILCFIGAATLYRQLRWEQKKAEFYAEMKKAYGKREE